VGRYTELDAVSAEMSGVVIRPASHYLIARSCWALRPMLVTLRVGCRYCVSKFVIKVLRNTFVCAIRTGFNDINYWETVGRCSSVGIATGYGLSGSGDRISVWERFSAPVQTSPGAHPASCTMGTGSLLVGKKRPWRDADPSPPSSDDV
jgi:hypothetical protein